MTQAQSPDPAPEGPIFFDPSRRRGRLLGGLGAASGAILAVGIGAFFLSVMVTPILPVPPFARGVLHHASSTALPLIAARDHALRRTAERNARAALLATIAREQRKKAAKPALPAATPAISAAFYAPWQETGLHSLRAHATQLTHVLPVWLRLAQDGVSLDTSDWDPVRVPHNKDVVQIARSHGVRIMPVITNASDDGFDRARVQLLLSDVAHQTALAASIAHWLAAQGFDGINVDFESLAAADYARLPAFLERLHAALSGTRRELSIDLEVEPEGLDVPATARACDFVVLMAYDEHWQTSGPGPISSLAWYRRVLNQTIAQVPLTKLVVGLASYAYDWPVAGGPAEAIGFQEAIQRAADTHPGEQPADIITFDPSSLELTYGYRADSGSGAEHEVWMLDAVTTANAWELARREGVRGAALWALGMEDPSTWNVLGPANLSSPPRPDTLQRLEYAYDVEFDGDGELLEVTARPSPGLRRLEFQASTGLVWDEKFVSFPTTYILRRLGLQKKAVALTFDDGPSPYTGQVLDALHELHVPAAFFIVGQNAEAFPGLVRRIFNEGHELGNHTYTHPNIGAISASRARLELNATQRALQTLVGRSTLLFRPPYNADAEPTSAEEVQPIITAAELGYITVGEYVDPLDWYLGTSTAPRTADDIATAVIDQIHTGHGNTVLLHDGGGDRSRTVAALPRIVRTLRAEGYRFVHVYELAGATRAQMMPALDPKEIALVGADRLSFELVHAVDVTLGIFFYLGIVFGVVRVLWIGVLAVIARGRERARRFALDYQPTVSVLIAAHNEAKVIDRTIQRILESDYPRIEVVVVDDGSQDATAAVVERGFGAEPRVVLVRQENAGKGAALNHAIQRCTGEILIGLDADTIFARDAVSKLVRHFSDPQVGAVAGNVKVGNRINVLTQWQSIEYITSQNLDRRAYSLLNAVTVVPGAVGAWRRRAVEAVGGYLSDTMAEDMDLTWRLRLSGWKIQSDAEAIAYTEAPDTWGGLAKQRFRWAYGTLQCLWKHRRALGKHGWFGRVVLPTLWLFQMVFQLIAPLVDLALLWSLGLVAWHWTSQATALHEWAPLPEDTAILLRIAFLYALFFVVDFAGALLAFRFDKESPKALVWLFWQRFSYRQLMYGVVLKSARTALIGLRTGWGKLERKGTVNS